MAKMNVYVPDDLKGRMDEVEGVNWSPLACRAFEAKLAEIITTKGAKNMQDVVTRLRASKARADNGAMGRGFTAGCEWAKDDAEADELERLEEWSNADNSQDFVERLTVPEDAAFGGHHHLVEVIYGEDCHRSVPDQFWEGLGIGDDSYNPAFLAGFAGGALSVWNQVKTQL